MAGTVFVGRKKRQLRDLPKRGGTYPLEILDPDALDRLASEIGVTTVSELIDYALDVLDWTIRQRNQNRRIVSFNSSYDLERARPEEELILHKTK